MSFTQALRPLAVDTVLAQDTLLLTALTGTEELSQPFCFVLDLLSEDRHVDTESLVGTPAVVRLTSPTGTTRHIHGLLRRVRAVGHTATFASYQAELVPWLWMLSLSTDCRIYQQLSVPEIIAQIFKEQGYPDFELRLVRTYPTREYCVQYRESLLAFVSRLLEDEGIAYHFAHSASKHTLVLTDSPVGVRPCPELTAIGPGRQASGNGTASTHEGDVYTRLTVDRTMQTRAVALADYDYLHPSAALASTITAADGRGEAFDYPGGFAVLDEGDRYARLRLEAADAQRETAEGTSGAAVLTPGYKVGFDGDGPGADGRVWLVTRVTHEARQGGYVAADAGRADVYTNQFTLASADLPWRPPRRTAHPHVRGTQSALVVGRSGEEIWTDTHGRVKLHFYWDRHGHRDENSSCWVRCSSAWAGRGYGQFSVPRMGQEVLVDFLEGDPDRPIVVGRVFNADQPPPCDPGGSRGVVSGVRSKTHKGSGHNSVTMDDTAGKEKLSIHAQHDMDTTVQHDDVQTVGHDRTEHVGNNESVTIGAARSCRVGGSDSLTVAHAQSVRVGLGVSEAIGAGKALSIGGGYQVSVGGVYNTTVAGAMTEQVGAYRAIAVAEKLGVSAKTMAFNGDDEVTIASGTASVSLKKDGTIEIAGTHIMLKAGAGLIEIDPSGIITIKGPMVKINT